MNNFEASFEAFLLDSRQVQEALELATLKEQQQEGDQAFLQVSSMEKKVYTTIYPPSWFCSDHLIYLLIPPVSEDRREEVIKKNWKNELAKAQAMTPISWNRTMTEQYPIFREDLSALSPDLAALYEQATELGITILGEKAEGWYTVHTIESKTHCQASALLQQLGYYISRKNSR